MKTLKGLFSKVAGFFQGGRAEQVFDQVADLVVEAKPLVEAIGKLTPNRTVQEIAAAYENFGVPLVQSISSTPPDQRGYLLLDLATKVLAKSHPVATNLLNTAVQIAVTGLRAK